MNVECKILSLRATEISVEPTICGVRCWEQTILALSREERKQIRTILNQVMDCEAIFNLPSVV